MNAGFSNLTWLKNQILSSALKTDLRFDPFITALGLGVYGLIEKYCNRKFMWQVGCQEVFMADRASFILERFPVVAPITLVEYKQDEPTGWVAQDQSANSNALVIQSLDAANGIIYFPDNEDCGPYWAQMRFTYTAGYFWQQLDPKDAGYVDPNSPAYAASIPAGAPLLPDSIRLAWLLQCKHIWSLNDKTGQDLLKSGSEKSLRFPEEWATSVEKILADHVRPQWT